MEFFGGKIFGEEFSGEGREFSNGEFSGHYYVNIFGTFTPNLVSFNIFAFCHVYLSSLVSGYDLLSSTKYIFLFITDYTFIGIVEDTCGGYQDIFGNPVTYSYVNQFSPYDCISVDDSQGNNYLGDRCTFDQATFCKKVHP